MRPRLLPALSAVAAPAALSRVRVEILGRDAPTYRPANGAFTVDVSRLRVTLPARERRPR